jgi:L-lactate dehydrogenase complex protein LldG
MDSFPRSRSSAAPVVPRVVDGTRESEGVMKSAKDEIFGRIRSANRNAEATGREYEYGQIERKYRQEGSGDRAAVIDCFLDRLHDYGCAVFHCQEEAIASTIHSVLNGREVTEILVSAGVPAAWRPEGIRFNQDRQLSYETIDVQGCVLTGCAVAIALTGTIILNHVKERRALTLIPDYHLCVVFEEQVLETVPEAIRQVSEIGASMLTTISGPSATADIEMIRIKGVHGPRSLDVILVESQTP